MEKPDENIVRSGPLISYKYLAVSIALSVATMSLVIWYTYTPDTLHYLVPKRLPGIFIAIAVTFLKVWFFAAKIRVLADEAISFMAAVRISLSWDFASAVTPSTIGGAPVATYTMTREGIPLGKSSAIMLYSVMLDQFWYAIAVPIILITGIFYEVVPDEIGLVGNATMFLIYTGLLLYGALLSYGLLVNPKAINRVIKAIFRLPLLRRYSESINAEAENLESYSYELRKKPMDFVLKAFFYTTMNWLCKVALPVIVVLSLLPGPEVLLVLRSLAMNLAFLIIPTPGGSGGVEGLFVLFLGPLIDRAAFIGLSVFVWRVITYYFSLGIGIMAMLWYVNRSVSNKLEKINMKEEEKEEIGQA
ncbi:lysylphosphatidylglycerol synthase transmembrane domain-containing protein [Rhodohalobacter mucosus]|nr:lysylphosphatidylglycerol synthase transmembrane domain-containing protein [Rhodohalobacter mucosus]